MKFFYLVQCEDWFVFKNFIDTNFADYKVVKSDALKDCCTYFYKKSLFSSEKKIYIINNIDDLNDNFDNIPDLISGKFQNNNIVIYHFSTIDKRSKIYKKYGKEIIMPQVTLQNLVVKFFEVEYDKPTCERLLNCCDGKLSSCYYELLKAKSLSNHLSIPFYDALTKILDIKHMLGSVESSDTFDYIDSIVNKDFSKLKDYLLKIDTKEFDFGVLTLLYNQYHNLYVLKEAGANATQSTTGLNPYIINNLSKFIGTHSLKQLNNILDELYNIDKSIKMGDIDSSYAYDLLLVRVLSC